MSYAKVPVYEHSRSYVSGASGRQAESLHMHDFRIEKIGGNIVDRANGRVMVCSELYTLPFSRRQRACAQRSRL